MVEHDVRQRSRHLHGALAGGEPTATARIAAEILPAVLEALRRKHARAAKRDDHPLYESVYDAFFEYVEKHTCFNPGRLDLYGYLLMGADRNLRNLLAKERTRRKYESSVELSPRDRNEELEEAFAAQDERAKRLSCIPGETLAAKVEHLFPNPADRASCMLMLQGERKTEAFAAALGLTGEKKRLQREVKRHKDRINKVLERYNGEPHERR